MPAIRDVPGTYATVSAAVAAATSGDTILVAAGYPGGEAVSVTVDNLTFNAPASVPGFVLTPVAGVTAITLAGASAIRINGNASNNFFTGNDGANILDGGSGDDMLVSSGGLDLLAGGDGNDLFVIDGTIAGSGGVVDGGADIDTVGSNDLGNFSFTDIEILETSLVRGTAEQIASFGTITDGSSGNSQIRLQLIGAGGSLDLSTRIAGAHRTVVLSSAMTGAVTVTGSLNQDSIDGTNFADNLDGGAGDDILLGFGGADLLHGGAGNDLLEGNADILSKGDGDTATYFDAGGGVKVTLLTDKAQDTVSAGVDTLQRISNLIGSAFNDTLTGDGQANRLDGGAGDDLLTGGMGADALFGGAGFDTASYEARTSLSDYMKGKAGSFVIVNLATGVTGGDAAGDTYDSIENVTGTFWFGDTLTGDDNANVLMGLGGNDTLDGGGGNDTLDGGVNNDLLIGGSGSDTAVYSGMASQYAITVNGDGSVTVVDDSLGPPDFTDTLQSIETIQLGDAAIGVAGNVLTQRNNDGSALVSTFNVTGQAFTGSVIAYDRHNAVLSMRFKGVTSQPYSSFEYDYNAGVLTGAKYFYTNVSGQPYSGYEQDVDTAGRLTKLAFTGVSGQDYSAYEYDYSGGKLAGSKYFFTYAPFQYYSGYEMDLDVNGRLARLAFTGMLVPGYSSYEYDYAGGILTGSKYFFTGVTGKPYTAYEQDLDSSGRLARFVFTGVMDQAYSSYAYDYQGGVLRGSDYFFTDVVEQAYTGYEQDLDTAGRLARFVFTGVSGQAYSSYEYDYVAGFLTGSKYFYTNIAGQPYTGYEQDLDISGHLTKLAFTGVDGQSYSSYEYDYDAGVLVGSKYFTANIAGRAYTGYEQDLDAQGGLTKLAFIGVVGQPYTAYEYDYSNGALTGAKYFYSNVPNQAYSSYETDLDAAGAVSLQILNNNDGSHRIVGFQDNLTIHSIFNDVITGGGGNETFIFAEHFGQSTVTDFSAHMTGAGHDSFQMPVGDFADFGNLLAHTQTVGGNAVIAAANGDQLTLTGVTKTMLTTLAADFSFA